MTQYRVDELAAEAGMTVRNVRAYQERGLLPAPRRDGRVAYYDDSHLGRLRVVGRMLDRGYSVANIAELMAEWERGHDLASVLGLESAVTALWPARSAGVTTAAELGRLFEEEGTDGLVDDVVQAGLIDRKGARLVPVSPDVLAAIAALVRAGVPRAAALELSGGAIATLEELVESLFALILTYVVDAGGRTCAGLPDDDTVVRTAAAAGALVPAVGSGLAELFGSMIERRSIAVFGERVGPLVAGGSVEPTARDG